MTTIWVQWPPINLNTITGPVHKPVSLPMTPQEQADAFHFNRLRDPYLGPESQAEIQATTDLIEEAILKGWIIYDPVANTVTMGGPDDPEAFQEWLRAQIE